MSGVMQPGGWAVQGAFDTTNVRGTAVACGNGAKGSWVQLVASVPFDVAGVVIYLAAGSNRDYLIDIGTGAAAAESVIVDNLYIPGRRSTSIGDGCIFLPLALSKGQRLVARGGSTATSQTAYVGIDFIRGGSDMAVRYDRIIGLGGVVASSRGTQIDPGGTAGTFGSWTQIVAATTVDIDQLAMGLGPAGTTAKTVAGFEIEVGVGASGSERAILRHWFFIGPYTTVPDATWFPFAPVSVRRGSRLAVRARANTAIGTSAARVFDALLYGGVA